MDLFMSLDFDGIIATRPHRTFDRLALLGQAEDMLKSLSDLGVKDLPPAPTLVDAFLEVLGGDANVSEILCGTSFDRKDRT